MVFLKLLQNEITKHKDLFELKNEIRKNEFKRFTELVIFNHYVSNSISSKNKINIFIYNQFKAINEDDIFSNFYTAFHFAFSYSFYRDIKIVKRIESCIPIIQKNKFISSEAPPHRMLEWDFWNFKLKEIPNVKTPNNSILKKDLYIQYFDKDLTYALTHSFFYVSDFGFLKIKSNKFEFIFGVLIFKYIEEKEIDLVLELLICYFGLDHSQINFNILEILTNLLYETNFIEFNLSKTDFDKKYHTLFVLGIFNSLIFNLFQSEKLSNDKKEKLTEYLSNINLIITNNYNKKTVDKEQIKQYSRWQIIKSLKRKDLNIELCNSYFIKHGEDTVLLNHIIFYSNYLLDRNKNNCLWSNELFILKINNKAKLKLSDEYNLKIKSKLEKLKKLHTTISISNNG